MAFYADEERVWKCAKHPSKRRRSGICPVCLQRKLASLCPDCARTRPCACTATSSSSSSSSYSCFSTAGGVSGVGSVGRVSNLIEIESSFRRPRSLAIPFLRLKPESLTEKNDLSKSDNKSKTPSFWLMFRGSTNASKRYDSEDQRREVEKESKSAAANERMMMRKSSSVAVTSHSGTGDLIEYCYD
ncbi:hypothetical protein F3Y22_tig00112159pilonHSYRG00113 [Hibiscus syriacus]|uniref:Uncharacterized protein n=1 Tax=Hibiscus syriacus TaxID=106335 RepID=A0A6A2YBX7_HIBSY|nr:uncharacterized protein LOC120175172 [Hibiscus syriacus]KAE8670257.1 hypothetical protein F3Y22_tig00112159pilonHSYRG00113 [Hibiscus syriacus]